MTGQIPDVPELARNGWELATWGIIAVIAVAVAAVYFGIRMLSEQRGTHTAVCAVRDQVENDHKSNFRHDVDHVAADVKEVHGDVKEIKAAMKRQDEGTQAAVGILTEEVRMMRNVLAELGKDITGLRRDAGVIRGELREHAQAHRDLESRVVQAFRREHPDAEPL